jgi:hypothetical protein
MSLPAFHPCWHCHYFGGFICEGTHCECTHARLCKVMADPQAGCAFWEREPGADDEAGPVQDRETWSQWWIQQQKDAAK